MEQQCLCLTYSEVQFVFVEFTIFMEFGFVGILLCELFCDVVICNNA
jgi:hypothetical protein